MLKIRVFLVTFIQIFTTCRLEIKELPDYEKHTRLSLTQCVLNATSRFFEEGQNLIYSLPIRNVRKDLPSVTVLDRFILGSLTQSNRWSIILKNVTLEQNDFHQIPRKPNHYIIQIRHEDEFIEHLNILRTYKNWNPHAKFLVISASKFATPRKLASAILEKLWQVHAVNGIVLLLDRINNTLFHAYTWFPYEDNDCGEDFEKVARIDSCSFGESTKFVDWYPNKIPKKFNNCPVNVRMVDWPPYIIDVPNGTWSNSSNLDFAGIEVSLLNLVAEVFNVRMFYYYSKDVLNWGEVYPNGTITGNLQYLYQERDDVAIGSYSKTMPRSIMFEDTFYHYESLHWCVPHISKHSKLDSLTKIMDYGAFIVTITVYLFLTVMIWLSSGSNNEWRAYQNFVNCMLKTFKVLLGLPVWAQPKTNPVRFFMFMLIIYSFYLVTAYQTLLASALADVSHEEQIKNIDDILENKMKIYGLQNMKRYFTTDGMSEETNKINAIILEKWINCHSMRKCLNHIAFRRDSAVALPKLFIEYIIDSYKTKDNDHLIHCFDNSFVSYPISILMRKGFQLYESVNSIIAQIVAAGFILKWEKDILRTRYEDFTAMSINISTSENDNLDFNSLRPIFVVWLIGCAISLTVFVAELIYEKWVNGQSLNCVTKRFFKN